MASDEELKHDILQEAHNSFYAMHPGDNKMCCNLKGLYWWFGMKRKVTEHVAKYLTCQQVTVEH